MGKTVRLLITGAAGRIGYSVIPLVGMGITFGPEQQVDLVLFDLPACSSVLSGLVMEIYDSLFSCINSVMATTNPEEAFHDVDYALLLGAFPRKAGMDRADLLSKNVNIFVEQGKLLDKYAKKSCKTVVVGNPANTNCLVLIKNAPSIPANQFTSMNLLDHYRLIAQVSLKTGVHPKDVHHAAVLGNHSNSQIPYWKDIKIVKEGKEMSVSQAIDDIDFLKFNIQRIVAKRGEAIINACKTSSAMSAARAASGQLHALHSGTKEGEWLSMGIYNTGHYNIASDIVYSFPVIVKDGVVSVVEGITFDDDTIVKMKSSEEELLHEKSIAFPQHKL